MFPALIARNDDLRRLASDGYEVEVNNGYLLIHNVPYVNASREVKRGILVSELSLAGDRTVKPGTHVAYFVGDHPCRANGAKLTTIQHGECAQTICNGVVARYSFSNKPAGGYPDYYAKMTRYIEIISNQAKAIDQRATAQTHYVIETSEAEDSVHVYIDTSSSRAGINAVTQKLKGVTVAIIGLGGTGSFVLDLVAKTSVREIRLFDDDLLRSHNAYRGPGAVSIDELRADPPKVGHYAERYARMHKRIVPHQVRVDASNMHLLDGVDFVFVCVDNGPSRRTIAQELVRRGVQFIDVGMGLVLLEDQATLIGLLRVTTSSHKRPYDPSAQNRLPFAEAPEDDEYRRNIQIADLNMLNAALAVVRWKRLYGLYQDLSEEHHSTFALNANELTGEDAPGGA